MRHLLQDLFGNNNSKLKKKKQVRNKDKLQARYKCGIHHVNYHYTRILFQNTGMVEVDLYTTHTLTLSEMY